MPTPSPRNQQYDFYADLAPELATKLRAQARVIRQCMTQTIESIVAAGKELLLTRDSLDHGQFLRWVRAELGISPSTAQRWMRVAERLGANASALTHLTLDAAYQLTSRDATPDIIAVVTAKAAAGEIVPVSTVKTMMSDVRDRRLMAEAEARHKERLKKMPRRKREELERQKLEHEERRREKQENARTAAAAIIERFGHDGARFILDAFTKNMWDLQEALERALGVEP
jgi:hypothetical protein